MVEKPIRPQAITSPALFGGHARSRSKRCVLVFTDDRARTIPLPESGEYVIGRSEECEIRVDDPSVSRNHARLHFGAELRIQDLGSSNGTRIGDLVLTPHQWFSFSLATVIGIGSSSLLVQGVSSQPRLRPLRSHAYVSARLEDEYARAEHMNSRFALIRLRCQDGASARVEEILVNLVRSMDIVAVYAPNEYELLLLDADRERAQAACSEIRLALRAQSIEAKLGYACAPADARTPERLISAAGEPIHGIAKLAPAASSILDRLGPMIRRVAAGNISVLLEGETGVGKEVLAHTIHQLSPRADKPLVCLNCASLSESLLESELFGYERGAFTGAVGSKAGLIESADSGTILLDEVGEMPLSTQAKLLRILEQRQVRRLGSLQAKTVNVRFIAATNRDLESEVAKGTFRADLYFRLNGATLVIPPLRERREEIRELAELFLGQFCAVGGLSGVSLSTEALSVLEAYSWPGNVRELRNVIERAVLLCPDDRILPEHLPLERLARALPSLLPTPSAAFIAPTPSMAFNAQNPTIPPPPLLPAAIVSSEPLTEMDQERTRIVRALEACAGNQSRAAKLLGVSRRTLINRIESLNIARPRKPIA